MRIKIEGQITKERVIEVLLDIMARAPEDSTLAGFNMYLNIRDAHGRLVEFLNEGGTPLDMVLYREERNPIPLKRQPPNKPRKGKPNLKVVSAA